MGRQLPENLEQMVRERMAAGQYASEDEVLLDAMLALEDVARREKELRTEIQRRVGSSGTPLSQPLDRNAFKAEARRRFNTQE